MNKKLESKIYKQQKDISDKMLDTSRELQSELQLLIDTIGVNYKDVVGIRMRSSYISECAQKIRDFSAATNALSYVPYLKEKQ